MLHASGRTNMVQKPHRLHAFKFIVIHQSCVQCSPRVVGGVNFFLVDLGQQASTCWSFIFLIWQSNVVGDLKSSRLLWFPNSFLYSPSSSKRSPGGEIRDRSSLIGSCCVLSFVYLGLELHKNRSALCSTPQKENIRGGGVTDRDTDRLSVGWVADRIGPRVTTDQILRWTVKPYSV